MEEGKIDLIGKGLPVLGMRSAVDPSQLPEGFWQVVENLRIGKGHCTPRYDPKKQNGSDLHADATVTGIAGYWSGYLNGVFKTYILLRDATNQLYEVNLSAYTATLIGGVTTGTFAEFAPYRDPSWGGLRVARDYLVVTDGVTQRAIDPTTATILSSGAAVPTAATEHTYQPVPSAYFNIHDPANTTYGASGASLVSADTAAAGLNEWAVTFPTAAAVNDTTDVTFAAGSCVKVTDGSTSASMSLDGVDQIWLLMSDTIGNPALAFLNVQVNIGGTYYTIYSATGTNKSEPVYVDLGSSVSGYYLVGITIDKGSTFPGGAFTALRFQVAKQVAAAHNFKVAGIMVGGNIPGASLYKTVYFTTGGGSESIVTNLKSLNPDMCFEYGTSRTLNIRMPNSQGLRYYYRLSYFDGAADAPYYGAYRKEPDQLEYYFSHYVQNINNSTAYRKVTYDVTDPDSVDYTRYAPSYTNLGAIPVGSTLAYANNRLYVGGSGSSNEQKSRLYISDEGYGTRFTPIAYDNDGDGIPDARSGTLNRFSGEKVVRIVPFTSPLNSTNGLATVIVWTNKGTRRIDGNDALSLTRPTVINQHGMQETAKFSVAQSRMSVYYVDADKIVRRIDAGIETTPISLWKVDDQIPSTEMFGLAWQDRYYLFYASGSVSYALIYDELLDEWFRDNYTVNSIIDGNSFKFPFLSDDFPAKAYAFTYLGKSIYRLEDPTSTTDPTIKLTSAEIETDGWNRVRWGVAGLVADRDTYTWTSTRTDPQDSGNTTTAAGQFKLDTDTKDRAWLEDRTSNGQTPGIRAPSCVLTLTGQYSPGKYIKRLRIRVESAGGRGAKGSG